MSDFHFSPVHLEETSDCSEFQDSKRFGLNNQFRRQKKLRKEPPRVNLIFATLESIQKQMLVLQDQYKLLKSLK